MAFYLGIDAGGTKTICAISDGREIIGRGASGTIKIKKVGPDKARIALEETLVRAFDASSVKPEQISASCIGVAGAGLPEVVEWTTSNMRELVPGALKVVGDSDIAHESAFHGGPGVLVIAGTGSIAIGKNARGITARAGGWGPMISDEGSGFWIGRRAVAAAMRAHDSGHATSLIGKIMEGWKIATRDAVVSIANSSPPPDFSALVPQVLECADNGDALAEEILSIAGAELAQLAKIVIRKLSLGGTLLKAAICGGVFKHSATVQRVFFNSLRADLPEVETLPEPVDPIYGAISLAIKEAEKNPS
jgi:glucosamine kinase